MISSVLVVEQLALALLLDQMLDVLMVPLQATCQGIHNAGERLTQAHTNVVRPMDWA